MKLAIGFIGLITSVWEERVLSVLTASFLIVMLGVYNVKSFASGTSSVFN